MTTITTFLLLAILFVLSVMLRNQNQHKKEIDQDILNLKIALNNIRDINLTNIWCALSEIKRTIPRREYKYNNDQTAAYTQEDKLKLSSSIKGHIQDPEDRIKFIPTQSISDQIYAATKVINMAAKTKIQKSATIKNTVAQIITALASPPNKAVGIKLHDNKPELNNIIIDVLTQDPQLIESVTIRPGLITTKENQIDTARDTVKFNTGTKNIIVFTKIEDQEPVTINIETNSVHLNNITLIPAPEISPKILVIEKI